MTQEELDQLQSKALEQFKTGKSLFGKGGAFAPMLKQFLESALEAEMEAHLDEEERLEGNKRNGRGKKTIKSNAGPVEIATPKTDRVLSNLRSSRSERQFLPTVCRRRS